MGCTAFYGPRRRGPPQASNLLAHAGNARGCVPPITAVLRPAGTGCELVAAVSGPQRWELSWIGGGMGPQGRTVPESRGGRPGSNRRRGDHDPGCCRYTTATMLFLRTDLSVPLSRPSASQVGAAVAVAVRRGGALEPGAPRSLGRAAGLSLSGGALITSWVRISTWSSPLSCRVSGTKKGGLSAALAGESYVDRGLAVAPPSEGHGVAARLERQLEMRARRRGQGPGLFASGEHCDGGR